MKKVIIIFGSPGIGKSTVGKFLYQRIDYCQYVDVDDLWRIHPFEVNDESKKLVEKNVCSLYQAFLDHQRLETLIITWVIPTMDLLQRIKSWFYHSSLYCYRLVASEDAYLARLNDDGREKNKFEEYLKINRQNIFEDVKTIDTTDVGISQIVDEIYNDFIIQPKENNRA